MEIVGSVKNYEWGKLGQTSEVASLAQANLKDFQPDDEIPYAELWMGDHPSGPSKIKATDEELGSFISKDKNNYIGGHEKLPFLLKVLSIRKALSIQVHPNKVEAEKLHAERPDIYKDPNHKPELAIALTPFLALCGFRPTDEVYELCQKFPSLLHLIGAENVEKLKVGSEGLKTCFQKLMESKQNDVEECIETILESYEEELDNHGLQDIFMKVNQDFPGDVGLLCIFFFNVIRLKPGEAIFLAANEPHAYLEGDCVECMACSDNVIRAGLTPKFKDVPTLIKMLNYKGLSAEKNKFQPTKVDSVLDLFVPEIEDFAVAKLCIPVNLESYKWSSEKFGSVLLVVKGSRSLKMENDTELSVSRGSIIFIPGNSGEIAFNATAATLECFEAYIACYNSFKK